MDIFAKEYGWAVVDSIYPVEVIKLLPQIKKRRIEDMKNQIMVAHHSKPADLYKELENIDKETNVDEELDKEGLMRLKAMLSQESKGIKVK